MSASKTSQEKAIAAVAEVNPSSQDYQLLYTIPNFINGELLVIRLKIAPAGTAPGGTFENYVYVAGDMVRVAKNTSHYAHLVQEESKRETAFAHFMDIGGIAGVIAIILTITICSLVAIRGTTDVPGPLASALATILGFYFGARATKGK